MPASEVGDALVRGTSIGRYVVLSKIGSGGMGVVYAAYDPELDRKVALKLLRVDPRVSEPNVDARTRLLREAQALARLSHPNVVAVHDVGAVGERVWLAMEFVEGHTLGEWGESAARSWRDVVDVMLRAGQGLAAAHASGLVHRDFKPDNVMVAHDGRVRVMDLGLARVRPEHGMNEPVAASDGVVGAPGEPRLLARVTVQGTVLGTPAYMAPEQFHDAEVDAAADIFAFCVTFWEALYGERPFPGATLAELVANVTAGKLRPPPRGRRVPAWLRRVLERGLAVAPQQRWLSMQALLTALDRGRARRRRLALLIVGAVALGLGAGLFLNLTQLARSCAGAQAQLAEVWDTSRREAVQRAFFATHVSFAPDTWTRTEAVLDEHARRWQEMFTDACVAHRQGEQSSTALDLRMVCLQRRRSEFAALLDVFAEADAQTVSNAVQAASSLPSITTCGDLSTLLDEQRRLGIPADPTVAASVELLRTRLAHVEALEHAGQIQRGIDAATTVIFAAQALGYEPLLAEALFRRGSLLIVSGPAEAAEVDLWQSIVIAMRSGHEELQARALVKDLFVLGYQLAEPNAAERAIQSATAMVTRVAPDSLLAAELRNNIAAVRANQGRHAEAEQLHRENLAFKRRILPEDHFEIGFTLANLGVDFSERGRFAEAEAVTREGLEMIRRSFGAEHPSALQVEANLALVLFDSGQHAEAKTSLVGFLDRLFAAVSADNAGSLEIQCVAAQLRLRGGDLTALAELERLFESAVRTGYVVTRYRTRFALAEALWEHAPDQRARALQLAREAESDARAMGDSHREDLTRAWIRERAPD
ncbi:serine/threonine-protein kinase [Nannocystis radixulma]|uniref:Serine/threonine-protein kinase n=1 Tax=Nannocystis radixulma TaxID=2995305 RepID=A0ABT5B833_9BACT|nr:serine/threonine-protein kinase [Nannocystis radixulma]MDC0670273.1 serine/threonine-protein kinase [Nannocystis radixulma]